MVTHESGLPRDVHSVRSPRNVIKAYIAVTRAHKQLINKHQNPNILKTLQCSQFESIDPTFQQPFLNHAKRRFATLRTQDLRPPVIRQPNMRAIAAQPARHQSFRNKWRSDHRIHTKPGIPLAC